MYLDLYLCTCNYVYIYIHIYICVYLRLCEYVCACVRCLLLFVWRRSWVCACVSRLYRFCAMLVACCLERSWVWGYRLRVNRQWGFLRLRSSASGFEEVGLRIWA